jgi:hypothetical protein
MFDTLVQIDPRLLGAVTTVLTLGTTLLGLAVGYIAFRGYRQGSRPMKFVAVGFLLVFWAPVLLFVGNLLVPGLPEFALGVLEQEFDEEMGIEDAKTVATKAIKSAMERDTASGNGINIAVVTDEGVEVTKHKEIGELLD